MTAVALNQVELASTAASATRTSARRAHEEAARGVRRRREAADSGLAARGIAMLDPVVDPAEQVGQPRPADGHGQQRLVEHRASGGDQEQRPAR